MDLKVHPLITWVYERVYGGKRGLPVIVTVASVMPMHRDNTYATSDTVNTVFSLPPWFPPTLVLAMATGPELDPSDVDRGMTMASNTSR